MRAFCFYLLIVGFTYGRPTVVRFDGHHLGLVDDPQEANAGTSTYKTKSLAPSIPVYEAGIVRIKDAPVDWAKTRESLLGVIRKKPVVLEATVRSSPLDSFVLVDYGYLHPDGQTFEYVILKHYLTAERDLISIDVRIRFPAAHKESIAKIQKKRELLVGEFTQLSVEIVK